MKYFKSKNTLIALSVIASISMTAPLFAKEGLYIGVVSTQTFVDEHGFDEDDTGGKLFAGYRFNNYIALEGGYYDFGEIGSHNNQVDINGFSLAAIGSLPVSSNLSLFAKVGAHNWDADARGSVADHFSETGDTDAFYGLGVDYVVSENWQVRGEVERYEVEDFDIDSISLGISYNF